MKVEELRVGNWVMGYRKPIKWSLENFDLLKQADLDEIIKEPIPLTEELLLKCGFKSVSGDAMVHKLNRHFRLEYALGEYVLRIKTDRHDSSYVRVVRSLHQLQNLYFDITGKELEVEL